MPGLWPLDAPVVIVGAGGFAREVLGICYDLGVDNRVAGFIDRQDVSHPDLLDGKPILGNDGWLAAQTESRLRFIVGIGDNPLRLRIARRLEAAGLHPATLISPHAIVSRFACIHPGSMICAGVIVNTDVTVGAHSIVNLNCTLGHDSILEPFVNLAPGVNVSGYVTLREGVYVGSGSAINEHLEIGSWTIIGSMAAVNRDLPANVTAVGVPAKPIRTRPAGWQLGGS